MSPPTIKKMKKSSDHEVTPKVTLKKSLACNIITFLNEEMTKANDFSDEHRESLQVAIQCLESAYDIDAIQRDSLPKINLLLMLCRELQQQNSTHTVRDTMNQHAGDVEKNYGNTAMKSGAFLVAISHYSKAIDLNPNCPVYYCNRAAAYSRLEKHHEAIIDCLQAIKLDPTYGKAHGRLGIAYSSLNMFNRAQKAYETALQYDPNNQTYKSNLELVQQRVDNLGPNMNGGSVNDPPQSVRFTTTGNGAATTTTAAPTPTTTTTDGANSFNIPNLNTLLSMGNEIINDSTFPINNVMDNIHHMVDNGELNINVFVQMGQQIADSLQRNNPEAIERLRRATNLQFQQSHQTGNNTATPTATSTTTTTTSTTATDNNNTAPDNNSASKSDQEAKKNDKS